MKVKVTVTVDIDPQAWAEEFGLDPDDTQAIREDVQTYFAGTVEEQQRRIGMVRS